MTERAAEVYKNLVQVLEDEIKVYRVLLDLVRREKEILVSARIDDLSENNRAKELLVLKSKGLDRIRETHARELAKIVGSNHENPRLLEIAAKMESVQNDQLRAIHTTLDLLIRRMKEINASNEALVKSSLKTVNGALGAIRDTLQPKATYAPSGDISKKENVSGHFVSKDV